LAGTASVAVRTHGLDQLVRDFGKLERELKKELQDELRQIADKVAERAKAHAVREGLVRSGKLVRSIKPGIRSRSIAVVRASATNKGFRYPALYEYGKGGVRSFLKPAAEAMHDETARAVEDMLDRLSSRAGF
jgi:hypothetical protein